MELLAEKLMVGWRCTFRDYSTRVACNTKIEGRQDVPCHMENQHGIPRDQVVFDGTEDVYRAMPEVAPEELQKVGAV